MAESTPTPRATIAPAEAEAARYALLRRLAPSFRHHLVVNLQPIGMIYEVMERRLRAPAPDLAHVQDSATKINGFAKAALASCLDVVGWLTPDEAVTTGVDEGARECAALLATSLSFRGYALRNRGIDEWIGLDFQAQSAWKCDYFGIEHERFKLVAWDR